jgi:tetratricopeptide (TPR) repeat protein
VSSGSAPPAAARPRRALTDPALAFDVLGVRSPLVGRGPELESMHEVIGRAIDFQAPQLITVVGNQGTGKTRLVSDLILQHVDPPARVFVGRATESGPRYGAIASLLRDRFRLDDCRDDQQIVERFTSEVRRVFGDDRMTEVLHFLGGFLDLHLPDSPFLRVLDENPAQHDEIARTVLRRFIEEDAQASPLVLMFDSLQWADDDTLRLLRELASGLGGSSVVLVCCARPEMLVRCGDWGVGAIDHLRIDLRNLEPLDAEQMFRKLLARCDEVPGDIIEDAVEMTGGNPYFLEQLVRLFLANGTIDHSGPRWRLDPARAAGTELPISIEEAIEARIAALEPAERAVLEKGAVFGNVFWVGAVVALTRIEKGATGQDRAADAPPPAPPPRDLEYRWTANDEPTRRAIVRVLDGLVEADYILRLDPEDSTIAGDVELVFKHNLERELVEKSTEPRRRQRYHRLAAQWLESNSIGRSEEQLEFLAQLYERGGDNRRAARCYLAGADKARSRYANDEAVELYTRGLDLIENDDALARLEALHNLGDVLDLTGRADEAAERFSGMLRLAWMFDNQAKGGAAHSRLGRIYRRRGEYDRAMEHLREANVLFQRAADRRGIAGTLDDIGRVHWLRGAYGQALEFHRQALSIRRAIGDRRSIALSLANIGRVHHDSGAFKAAITQFREALDLRRDIGDLSGVVSSLCDLGTVHSEDRHHDMALELFSEAYKIAVEIGDKMAQADVLSRMGECKSALGRGRDAVEDLEHAIGLATQLGDRVALSACCRRLGEVHLILGDVEAARDHARRALLISEAVGSRVHVGTAHRALGEIEAAGELDEETRARAGEHFDHAVKILAGMRNELELARCYRSYAIFCERCGLGDDAAKLRRRADEIFGRLRGAASFD